MILRRLILLAVLWFAALGIVAPASALTLAVKQVLGPPGWVLPYNPDLQNDFARGAAWKGTGTGGGAVVPVESLLTVTRASACLIDDLSGYWTQRPANTLCRSNKGATPWEARTNGVRNNTMQGAVAGTPGTPPTNWGIGSGTGLTIQLVAVGVGGTTGADYVEYRLSGTSGSTSTVFQYETTNGIAAVNGQTWANSVFLSIPAGSASNISGITVNINQYDSGGAFLSQLTGSGISAASLTGYLVRYSTVATTNNASTAFVRPIITVSYGLGVAIDVTFRIAWPQMELGSFVTSPILTTGLAVTRDVSVVTVAHPLPVLGSATYFASFVAPPSNAINRMIISVYADANNRDIIFVSPLGLTDLSANTISGGVNSGRLDGGAAFASGVAVKAAYAVTVNDRALSVNGSVPVTSAASAARPLGSQSVHIGTDEAGGSSANTYIKSVPLWLTKRLPNEVLQDLTR